MYNICEHNALVLLQNAILYRQIFSCVLTKFWSFDITGYKIVKLLADQHTSIDKVEALCMWCKYKALEIKSSNPVYTLQHKRQMYLEA